jgi:hypothetical protein
MNKRKTIIEKLAILFVALMVLLQCFYAIMAYFDASGFADLRGTKLATIDDLDWVKIYASRTFFIALIIGYLLYIKDYKILIWAALFGTIMPITDGYLAIEAQAPVNIIIKHMATTLYLIITALTLKKVINDSDYKKEK